MTYRAPLDEMRRTMFGYEDVEYTEGRVTGQNRDMDGDTGTQLQVIQRLVTLSLCLILILIIILILILFFPPTFILILTLILISLSLYFILKVLFFLLYVLLMLQRMNFRKTLSSAAITTILTKTQIWASIMREILVGLKEAHHAFPLPLALPLLLFYTLPLIK